MMGAKVVVVVVVAVAMIALWLVRVAVEVRVGVGVRARVGVWTLALFALLLHAPVVLFALAVFQAQPCFDPRLVHPQAQFQPVALFQPLVCFYPCLVSTQTCGFNPMLDSLALPSFPQDTRFSSGRPFYLQWVPLGDKCSLGPY